MLFGSIQNAPFSLNRRRTSMAKSRAQHDKISLATISWDVLPTTSLSSRLLQLSLLLLLLLLLFSLSLSVLIRVEMDEIRDNGANGRRRRRSFRRRLSSSRGLFDLESPLSRFCESLSRLTILERGTMMGSSSGQENRKVLFCLLSLLLLLLLLRSVRAEAGESRENWSRLSKVRFSGTLRLETIGVRSSSSSLFACVFDIIIFLF
mmetsp:Transcript_17116/g.42764  ORF Transcript_17116/g.42764 Transcript_17116/m.42764 type:complete len:206 (+) Transcript_17116:1066-1683(+)